MYEKNAIYLLRLCSIFKLRYIVYWLPTINNF